MTVVAFPAKSQEANTRPTSILRQPHVAALNGYDYPKAMTKEQVKEILERVLTWPPERQESAARVLAEMEEQDASAYGLSDEQVEEVRRRRQGFREGIERYATDEEIAALWKKCGL
jgi:hypothetical protein